MWESKYNFGSHSSMDTRPPYPRRHRGWSLAMLILVSLLASWGRADKVDELIRALQQDSSYKVRVQAALVLGKFHEPRATEAIRQALSDINESVRAAAAMALGQSGAAGVEEDLKQRAESDSSQLVRTQAQKALAMLTGHGGGGASVSGARAAFSVGFQNGKWGRDVQEAFRARVAHELQTISGVTIAGAADKKAAAKSSYLVDGTIVRLDENRQGGSVQIECDVKVFVAAMPGRMIRMMTSQGASLQTQGDATSAKKECLAATASAIAEDVKTFLSRAQ